ncbi:TIGR02646 family protein [Pseudomonas allii]|uniref:TIGR02646 family protein n=2 Tax=Pseudomonas allii TaxID=2740531 RepID=A0ACC6LFH3_9PSED|nr:TIGR02646 family protein [Pseudomonas allii]MDR9877058.1 TIGR02646 family protein [Pseudomonas allii]NWN47053.1 TIGR02646 family protein [Pseudomonas allii]NWN62364.1 TIGR02646 family protein [Pseudomonas allii]
MRKITKGKEPAALTQWKRTHPKGRYRELTHEERSAIRQACIDEQYGLCAHCCDAITLDRAHNEHVEAQRDAQNRTVDFSNIVASCNRPKQCGDSHAHQALPLTALMDECETELKFYLSGRVEGLTPRAITSIQVLNLGDSREKNRALFNARRDIINTLLFNSRMDGSDLKIENIDLLTIIEEELQQPDENGQLKPFSPVLVNVIRQISA